MLVDPCLSLFTSIFSLLASTSHKSHHIICLQSGSISSVQANDQFRVEMILSLSNFLSRCLRFIDLIFYDENGESVGSEWSQKCSHRQINLEYWIDEYKVPVGSQPNLLLNLQCQVISNWSRYWTGDHWGALRMSPLALLDIGMLSHV